MNLERKEQKKKVIELSANTNLASILFAENSKENIYSDKDDHQMVTLRDLEGK